MAKPCSSLVPRIARAIIAVPALVYFLFADLVRWAISPALAFLARLRFWQRVEAAIGALPSYGALLVLAVPVVLLEPPKLLALWWIATGHVVAGMAMLLAAKVLGLTVVLRLHAIAEPKLLSIGWYARLHEGVLALRRRIYDPLLNLPFVLRARDRARDLRAGLRRWWRG
jgi:hypothetical protein